MRAELKNFNWHKYGVSERDYDHTLRLLHELIEDRRNQLKIKTENIEVYDFDGNLIDPKTGQADEAIDDLAYYSYIDDLFIWHFGLWRLQAIFEGIIKQYFFPKKRLLGLKAKLDFILKINYNISKQDYDELIEWGKLRNALSHHPPEQYRPIQLDEDDVKEYASFLKRLTNDLKGQIEKNTTPQQGL